MHTATANGQAPEGSPQSMILLGLHMRKMNDPCHLILSKVPRDVVLRNLTIHGMVTGLYRACLAEGVLLVSALISVKPALGSRSSDKAIRILTLLAL